LGSIGFGIVGCGFFGGEFARIIHELEGAHVAAVFGGSARSTSAVAAETQCEVETSLERLVQRSDVDAVIVASPNHVHLEPVLLAAQNGKHVFCEKPVALRLDECMKMVNACAEANVHLMAGHILHFVKGIAQVKQWVREGAIGDPIVCHVERTGWEPKRQDHHNWKSDRSKTGGSLFHNIHELDLMLTIMGPAAQVFMAADRMNDAPSDSAGEEHALMLTLQFANGGIGTMQYGSGFRWPEHYMKINGSQGAIKIDFRSANIELRTNSRATFTIGLHENSAEDNERVQLMQAMNGGVIYGDPQLRPPGFLRTAMKKEIVYFRDVINGMAIDDDKRMLFDGTAAIRSVATAEAAMYSKQSGQASKLETR